MTSSLVGSEMCIRDSFLTSEGAIRDERTLNILRVLLTKLVLARLMGSTPVSYTHLTLPTICSV
eukprot:3952738-Prorocentrum_lima.AAC.1